MNFVKRVVFDTSTLVSAALRPTSIPRQAFLKAVAEAELRSRLQNAHARDPQGQILLEGRLHQVIERRIVEDRPPVDIFLAPSDDAAVARVGERGGTTGVAPPSGTMTNVERRV
mgnify:CR=1 FL=1